MPSVEISVPTTSTATEPSLHTVYHITLRLPLRTFTLEKRYSDFAQLHKELVAQSLDRAAPPAALPGKTFFSRTVNNPEQIEARRQGLEAYLRAINDAPDPRWRSAPAWRAFLNLPASMVDSSAASTSSGKTGSSATNTLHAAVTAPDRPIADPVAWLDAHRELKAYVHAARSALASRDAGGGASAGAGGNHNDHENDDQKMVDSFAAHDLPSGGISSAHEAASAAKKSLLRASALLKPLEQGLREHGGEWSRKRLGEGEVRRRKDLLAAARKDIAGLENLATLVRRKGEVDGVVDGLSGNGSGGEGKKSDAAQDKKTLLQGGVGKGRVLGKETARTRELDNTGVLQLQKQIMEEQDQDIDTLAQAVRRQRILGEQIHQELEVQTDLLNLLDEDVDRVQGKLGVAKKRVDKIS